MLKSGRLRLLFGKKIIILLFVGLLLRLLFYIFINNTVPNSDTIRYKDWGYTGYTYGFAQTYNVKYTHFRKEPNNQPPGFLYVLTGIYYMYDKLFIVPDNTSSLYQVIFEKRSILDFLIRLPAIIADLAITLVIYIFVRHYKPAAHALFASLLFLLNPVSIYNSVIWGQTDALYTLPLLLAIILLICKFSGSGFLFLASLLVKLSALPFLPFFTLLYVRNINIKKIFVILLGSLVLIFLFLLPITYSPYHWLTQYVTHNSGGELQFITANALNFWWALFIPTSLYVLPYAQQKFLFLSLETWGYGLFFVSVLPSFIVLFMTRKDKIKPEHSIFFFSIIAFSLFLFLPKMHERYLYPFFPLFALYIGLTGKYSKLFFCITILHFFNLYAVWNPYNFVAFNSILRSPFTLWGISVSMLGIGFYILFSGFNTFKQLQYKN